MATINVTIPASLKRALQALAKEEGVGASSLLSTSFAVYLGLAGREDLLAPTHNPDPETQEEVHANQ